MAIINIRSILVYMQLYISPGIYGPHVTTEREGTKKLSTQYMSDIYGTMVASIL